METEVVTKLCC